MVQKAKTSDLSAAAAALGKVGGQRTSPAKVAAASRNGKKAHPSPMRLSVSD